MKRTLLLLMTSAVLLAAAADATAADQPRRGRGALVHMVSFKFKDTATRDDIRKVEEAFAALPGKIPQIVTYESGTNVSPEKLDKGFTHGFLLTFRSAEDRDAYLVHPEHQEFGKMLGPYLADVFVLDFWTRKPAAGGAGSPGR